MSDIEIVSGHDAIAALGPMWTDVAGRVGGAGIFDQFELVRQAAALAERAGQQPLVVLIARNDEVVTLLPLRRERRYGVRAAVPLVHPLAQYTNTVGWAMSAHDVQRLCGALARSGLDLLLLRKVRQDSGLHEALDGLGCSQRAHETALFIDLAAFETFAAYERSFSSTTRRNRRQRRQKLETQLGPLSFDVVRGQVRSRRSRRPYPGNATGWRSGAPRARCSTADPGRRCCGKPWHPKASSRC